MASARSRRFIRRLAFRVTQDPEHPLYLFALTGEELFSVADISRIGRSEAGKLIGYQRPHVRRHIRNIVEYLDSDTVLFPSSLILALSSSVQFRAVRGPRVGDSYAEVGTIESPRSHRRWFETGLDCRWATEGDRTLKDSPEGVSGSDQRICC